MSGSKPSVAHYAAYHRIAHHPEFRSFIRSKMRFIAAATLFFCVYYFALPILAAAAPDFMKRPVWGRVNVAYVFALSQFFMAWALAAAYLFRSARYDARVRALTNRP